MHDIDRNTTAVIRTSDRMFFRKCRRRWAWQSHLKANLQPTSASIHLWFGTGIHFALEDYHGWQKYETPEKAFTDYVSATRAAYGEAWMPAEYEEQAHVGVAMLKYYREYWLGKARRSAYRTFYWNGVPQVEVNFVTTVPFDPKSVGSHYERVVYSGTIDRVVEDDNGSLWIVDYKTAKQFRKGPFDLDSQITTYLWAASNIYKRPIAGMIYWQFLKEEPKKPRVIRGGQSVSTAANLRTSRELYREALIDVHGAVEKASAAEIKKLNMLTANETEHADPYIRRDFVYRPQHALEAEGEKILMEVSEMLNPDLPLYPNPDYMCPYMCPFHDACLAMDNGDDWELILGTCGVPEDSLPSREEWKKYLQIPFYKEQMLGTLEV